MASLCNITLINIVLLFVCVCSCVRACVCACVLLVFLGTTVPRIMTRVVGVWIVILWRPGFFIRWWQLGSGWYYMKSGAGVSFGYIWCSLKSAMCLSLKTICWRGTVGWVGRLYVCWVGRSCVPVVTISDGRGRLNKKKLP